IVDLRCRLRQPDIARSRASRAGAASLTAQPSRRFAAPGGQCPRASRVVPSPNLPLDVKRGLEGLTRTAAERALDARIPLASPLPAGIGSSQALARSGLLPL